MHRIDSDTSRLMVFRQATLQAITEGESVLPPDEIVPQCGFAVTAFRAMSIYLLLKTSSDKRFFRLGLPRMEHDCDNLRSPSAGTRLQTSYTFLSFKISRNDAGKEKPKSIQRRTCDLSAPHLLEARKSLRESSHLRAAQAAHPLFPQTKSCAERSVYHPTNRSQRHAEEWSYSECCIFTGHAH